MIFPFKDRFAAILIYNNLIVTKTHNYICYFRMMTYSTGLRAFE